MFSINRQFLIAMIMAVCAVGGGPTPSYAHDASAWGGLFRSRDGGATWFQASAGKLMGGALAVAVDPTDSTHLLLATDSGLLASANGGRDWEIVAHGLLDGRVFAVAFDVDSSHALAAGASAFARSEDGVRWASTPIPVGAVPVRELLPGPVSGGFYLVGWHGLFRTDDAGRTWTELGAGLPGSTADRLVNSPLGLLALAAGDIWVSRDGGRGWEVRQAGLPAGQLQAVGYAAERPSSLWAAGANHVFRTDDAGLTWQSIGRALPDGGTRIHRIAVDAGSIVLSTDHGLYRMREGGQHWEPLVDNLPGHIEAGPLVRDDRESSTLYVGFSVTPYAEIWRNSAEGGSALGQLGASELVGGGAFLGLLGVCAWVALRWLARRGRPRFTGGVA